jgi:hypothetical protein
MIENPEVSRVNGRHEETRTPDLYRVKASISHTFNNLQAAGDCLTTRKNVEDDESAGDFTGEKQSEPLVPTYPKGIALVRNPFDRS